VVEHGRQHVQQAAVAGARVHGHAPLRDQGRQRRQIRGQLGRQVQRAGLHRLREELAGFVVARGHDLGHPREAAVGRAEAYARA
jgi:hypothetical protein